MTGVGVSACLIVRDEEAMLGDCLRSLAPWVDQICVVDTGSTDRTLEVARACGAKVAHVPWEDDFSKARNASLALADQPWIFVVDADERLDPETGPLLRDLITRSQEQAHLVLLDDPKEHGRFERSALLRVFRNRPEIRFERPVHENVMASLDALGVRSLSTSGVRLIHLGYTPEMLRARNKHARNLSILERRFREQPDDLFNAYKLALTLPPANVEARLAVFTEAQRSLAALAPCERAQLTFAQKLSDAHAACLMQAGRLAEALAMLDAALSESPEALGLCARKAELLRRLGRLEESGASLPSVSTRDVDDKALARVEQPHEIAVRVAVTHWGLCEDGLSIAAPSCEPVVARDIRVTCAQLRFQLVEGQVAQVSSLLSPLLETNFQDDEVKLLGAEVALLSGDLTTAESMWRLTDSFGEAGHRAHRWLALITHLRGHALTQAQPVRDVSDAALLTMLGNEALDASMFEPAHIERAKNNLLRWLAAFA